eukprot:2991969-Pyramimonas_sp.AAC.1
MGASVDLMGASGRTVLRTDADGPVAGNVTRAERDAHRVTESDRATKSERERRRLQASTADQ